MSNKNRLISIKNWEKYQFSDNKTTTNEQQVNTYKNVRNINIKNILIKYIGENSKTFFEKRNLLKKIKQDNDYLRLNSEEQKELIDIVLKNTNQGLSKFLWKVRNKRNELYRIKRRIKESKKSK